MSTLKKSMTLALVMMSFAASAAAEEKKAGTGTGESVKCAAISNADEKGSSSGAQGEVAPTGSAVRGN